MHVNAENLLMFGVRLFELFALGLKYMFVKVQARCLSWGSGDSMCDNTG